MACKMLFFYFQSYGVANIRYTIVYFFRHIFGRARDALCDFLGPQCCGGLAQQGVRLYLVCRYAVCGWMPLRSGV